MALTISICLEEGGELFDLHPKNSTPPGFLREQRSYALIVNYNGNLANTLYELLINDYPAERIIKGKRDYYRFSTDFYAGDVRITLASAGKVLFDHQLVIDPDRFKLTRTDYRLMVADIRRATLALYRFGNVTLPAPTSASARRTALLTLELIRAHFAQFESAVSRVARQPATHLAASSKRVDVLSARRLESRNLVRALRSKSMRKATNGERLAAPKFVAATKGYWVQKVDEAKRVETRDIYEHRAILGFIMWLEKILAHVLHDLDPDQAELPLSIRHRIENWRSRLRKIRSEDLFRGIKAETALRATTRFRMHPDYANIFTAMSAMRSGLGDREGVVSALPVDRTYVLYEMWCYIKLLEAASELVPSTKASIAGILRGIDDPSRLGVVLSRGDPSRIDLGDGCALTYQRRFSTIPDGEGARTFVLDAIPDVCLSALDENGQCKALAVFDPKYRVGSSLLDGLRDLHVYRDAIVGSNGPLVRYAVALTPGSNLLNCEGGSIPEDRPAALRVRPGHDSSEFRALLKVGMSM